MDEINQHRLDIHVLGFIKMDIRYANEINQSALDISSLSDLPIELFFTLLDNSSIKVWCALACTSKHYCYLVNEQAGFCCRRLGFSGQIKKPLLLLANFLRIHYFFAKEFMATPVSILLNGLLSDMVPKKLLRDIFFRLHCVKPGKYFGLTCSILDILLALEVSVEEVRNNDYMLEQAMEHNDIGALQYLFEKMNTESLVQEFRYRALLFTHKSLDALKFLIQVAGLTADEVRMVTPMNIPIIWAFPREGLPIFKYLVETLALTSEDVLIGYRDGILYDACRLGNLDVIQYVLSLPGISSKNIKMGMARSALWPGHRHIIEYFFDPQGPVQLTAKNVRDDNMEIMRSAAFGGHDQMFLYLFETLKLTTMDIRCDDNKILFTAISQGHLNVVKCLFETAGLTIADARAHGNSALNVAAKCGKADIIIYLIEHLNMCVSDVMAIRSENEQQGAGRGLNKLGDYLARICYDHKRQPRNRKMTFNEVLAQIKDDIHHGE